MITSGGRVGIISTGNDEQESSFERVWTVEPDKVLTQEQSQSSRLGRV